MYIRYVFNIVTENQVRTNQRRTGIVKRGTEVHITFDIIGIILESKDKKSDLGSTLNHDMKNIIKYVQGLYINIY